MNVKLKICSLMLIIFVLCGCSAEPDPFVIPVNYTGEAVVKVYTEKSENTYDVNIVCRDSNYSLKINTENESWNSAFLSDGRCVLSNDRFPESSVRIENLPIGDLLVYDLNLSKFNDSLDTLDEELIYLDGNYKHVLNFSEENLLPSKIFIYKNDNLVKAIQYKEINIEE